MFSLRTLFIVVAVAGLGVAALVNRTPIWAYAFVTLTLALILAATVLAILRPARRAFWVPVAVVGTVHLAIIYGNTFDPLAQFLVTSRLTVKTCGWVLRSEWDAQNPEQDNPFDVPARQPLPPELTPFEGSERPSTISDVMHLSPYWYYSAESFWTLILAFGSGCASWYFLRPVPAPLSPLAPHP